MFHWMLCYIACCVASRREYLCYMVPYGAAIWQYMEYLWLCSMKLYGAIEVLCFCCVHVPLPRLGAWGLALWLYGQLEICIRGLMLVSLYIPLTMNWPLS